MPDKRGVYPGQWGLVGGGVEPNEGLTAALSREVYEETGLSIGEPRLLEIKSRTLLKHTTEGTEAQRLTFFVYLAEVVGSGRLLLNHEWQQGTWVEPHRVTSYDLNEATLGTWQLYLELKQFGLL